MSPSTSQETDRANTLPWPPILYAVALLSALAQHWIVPLPAFHSVSALSWLGWVILAIGVAIAIAGIMRFKAIGTPVDPAGRAKVLSTEGIYRWTRNPMYLGGCLGFLGLALALASWWLLAWAVAMPVLLTKLAIEREEAYLLRRFGQSYADYKGRVRRWL